MASLIARLAPGSVFAERFRILGFVGQRRGASVYRAEALNGGPLVSLELLPLDSADGRAARRFDEYAASARRLRSPHVARTLDAGKLGDGLGWIATEDAPGQSLGELLESRSGLELLAARPVLMQLFGAVAAAHDVGIVHLDLVPDNVRVSEQDGQLQLKVLGFLGARGLDVDSRLEPPSEVGCSGWTAPEQKRGGYQPEATADVWSLGSLTFFALTGGVYFRTSPAGESSPGPDPESVPASRRAQELGLPRALPPGFDAWFSRAVRRDAARRFTDGAEAWAALLPVLSGQTTSREPSRRVSVAPGLFLTAVILGVVTMGLAIYGLLRSMRI